MIKLPNPASLGRIDPANWRNYEDHYTESLWPAQLPSKPKDYGSNDFHGRTHPDIIRVAMERYTKRGDIVLDPMVGSGTTIDVCHELGNPCIAYDIKPARNDVIAWDARQFPDFVEYEIDLIILHPPYMNIINYGSEGGLVTSDLDEYVDNMQQVLKHMTTMLKDGHVMVLIIGMLYGNVREEFKETICLDYELWPVLCDDYRLLGRIVRPFGETKGGSTTKPGSQNLWKVRRLRSGLWSLGVDTVLFLQKLPKN